MKNPQEIISTLKTELEKNSKIMGLVLAGSYARETIYKADPYSDMEAYIIVEDDQEEELQKELPEIVKNLGTVVFSYQNLWAGFSTVFDDLFRLELPVIKRSDISSAFSRPKAQEVKIIFDKTAGELQKVLDQRPETLDFEKIFQDQITHFWYMAILAVQYFKKGEIYNSRNALQILQSSLIKLFELLQDPSILLLETNKRIEQFLSHEQIEILKQLSSSYDQDQIKKALIKILSIFSQTAQNVDKRYQYKYNQDIENQIKPKLENLLKR
ncbi:MAG: aminoglycoside 6-adenylyltransferase [Candidatus Daviesbacteria bacterium]|nr:aminoglycoside 6-adenylyltransferase [Candidatus Daviesbacteria bacterium]